MIIYIAVSRTPAQPQDIGVIEITLEPKNKEHKEDQTNLIRKNN